MDARSVSYTAFSRRGSSRAYQDLASCRLFSPSSINSSSQSYIVEDIRHRALRPSTPPHIGIIGAGVAGLRCADVLLQRGFRVTILEGRDRIGGRMHQIRLQNTNHLVDTGPNWIHGTDHNPIFDLALETNTPMHSWGEKVNLFDEGGEYVSVEAATDYCEIFWGIVADAFKYSSKNTDSIPADQSLYDWFVMKVNEPLHETEHGYEARMKFLMQMSEMWGAFVGTPIEKQSLKFFWLEECIEGENLFCAGTYQNILALIAKPAVEKAAIKFLTKITKIDAAQQPDGNVTVITDKHEILQFDEVVVTAPLGWLKQNQDAFTPPLPARLSRAISSIGYGCLEKIHISFPRAFWLAREMNGYPHLQANTSQSTSDPDYTGFSQFLSPQYSPLNPQRWNQEVVELGTLPDSSAHPTLLFYIFGDQSRTLAAKLSRCPSEQDRHKLLVTFFYPYFSRLPNFLESNPDCIPVSSHGTEWVNDDLAGNGSYSNFQTGLEEGDKDIEIMRGGLPERGVWLAGEHTAPFVAVGTVTGAYWSGEGVARRISHAYGMAGEDATFKGVFGVAENGTRGSGQEVNVRGFTDVALEK